MEFAAGLLVGLFVGVFVGIIVLALAVSAASDDEMLENQRRHDEIDRRLREQLPPRESDMGLWRDAVDASGKQSGGTAAGSARGDYAAGLAFYLLAGLIVWGLMQLSGW